MKRHRMPFEYWEDDHTALLRRTREPRWADDREFYVRQFFHGRESGTERPYFLNRRGRVLYDRQGPFEGRYRSGEELVSSEVGRPAYIFCPGPSMAQLRLEDFRSKLTMAVNSAAFAMRDAQFWVMAESGYARWLLDTRDKERLRGAQVISTARVAINIRDHEVRTKRKLVAACYIIRWEEEMVVPPRTPAVSITNALVTAWQMGCPEVYVIGLDLSKKGGAYMPGVPFTKEGAKNPFRDQILALRQFELPGMEVFNASPLSWDALPNFTPIKVEDVPR